MQHDLDTLHALPRIVARLHVSSHPQHIFFCCDHREIPHGAKKTVEGGGPLW
jgi:hypothetical protein